MCSNNFSRGIAVQQALEKLGISFHSQCTCGNMPQMPNLPLIACGDIPACIISRPFLAAVVLALTGSNLQALISTSLSREWPGLVCVFRSIHTDSVCDINAQRLG